LHAFDGAMWRRWWWFGERDDKRLGDVLMFDITYMEGLRPPMAQHMTLRHNSAVMITISLGLTFQFNIFFVAS